MESGVTRFITWYSSDQCGRCMMRCSSTAGFQGKSRFMIVAAACRFSPVLSASVDREHTAFGQVGEIVHKIFSLDRRHTTMQIFVVYIALVKPSHESRHAFPLAEHHHFLVFAFQVRCRWCSSPRQPLCHSVSFGPKYMSCHTPCASAKVASISRLRSFDRKCIRFHLWIRLATVIFKLVVYLVLLFVIGKYILVHAPPHLQWYVSCGGESVRHWVSFLFRSDSYSPWPFPSHL